MKTLRILMMSFIVVSIVSCGDDFLEPVPTAVIVGENYPNNEEELETVLVSVYDALQGVNSLQITSNTLNHAQQIEYYVTEMLSDNTRSKSGEGEAGQFDNFTVQPTNNFVFDYYRSMYDIINKSNLVLENISLASDDASRIQGEARFMRALAHFNLLQSFGDIPLLDRTVVALDTEIQFTRVPTSDVFAFIIEDLQFAVSALGSTSSPYRASKNAARGILAKVYMTQGTNYTIAQGLLEDIINSEEYSLEADFRDVFYNEANSETIFSVGYVGTAQDSQNFSAEMLNGVGRTAGVNYVTDEAIAALDAFGGDRAQYSKRVDAGQITQTQVTKYLPNGDTALGIEPTSTDPTNAVNDWIILRYADVLLLHVESILAGGQSTAVESALESFQLVRDRAGVVGDVEEISATDLLVERRVELAFENHRIQDLRRFGVAQQVLSDFSAANGHSFSATDLLLPIPQFEINLSNGAMSQNPGY